MLFISYIDIGDIEPLFCVWVMHWCFVVTTNHDWLKKDTSKKYFGSVTVGIQNAKTVLMQMQHDY